MSKHTSHSHFGGRMQSPDQKLNGGAHGSPHKMNKKPMKSNITNKAKPRHAAEIDEVDDESDEDGGGSSANEELTPTSDDADVFALSGAQQPVLRAAESLAGHGKERDEMLSDIEMEETQHGASDEEDDYGDVDNISDSDDEELGMGEDEIEKSAEQDLIEEFEKTEQRRNSNVVTQDFDIMHLQEDEDFARQLGLLQDTNDLFHGDVASVDLDADPYYGHPSHADEYIQLLGDAEHSMWRLPDQPLGRENGNPISGTQKRVRFDKTPCSSPSVSEDEDPNGDFPDLFASADDPTIIQQINVGTDYDNLQEDYDDAASFYDFDDEDDEQAYRVDEESSSDDETSSHDSDDEGDTTDEETAEEQIAKLEERKLAACKSARSVHPTPVTGKQATPRTPRTSISRPSTAGSSTTPRPGTPITGKGPKSGVFPADPSRAAITVDHAIGRLKIQPPTKPLDEDKAFWERARSVVGSRDGSRRSSFQIMRSNSSESMPSRPFTAKSTLGSMFNGNLDIIRNHDEHGIAEELFPQLTNRPQSSFSSLTGTEEGDVDRRMDLDMEDLVNIDDSDSETEGAHTGMVTSPTKPDMYSSLHSGGSLERSSSDLLNHFTQHRTAIGAFRQNQHFAKQLSSQALHPAQRASTHEFNALQKGRRGAANTPITPARKKRVSQDLTPIRGGVRKSVNSPLANRRPRSRGNSNANLLQTFTRDPFAD